MFKVIDLLPEGKLNVAEGEHQVGKPGSGIVRWIDLCHPTDEELEKLRQEFDFHPLTIDDCKSFQMRSKLEEFRDFLFVVLHSFSEVVNEPETLQTHEIHCFVTSNALVTVHENPLGCLDAVWQNASSDPALLSRGSSWVLYLLGAGMVDAIFPLLDNLTDRVTFIEAEVLENRKNHSLLAAFSIRSTLVTMKRVLRPLRDVVNALTRRTEAPLSDRTALYFRDVHDEVQRSLEAVEECESLLNNLVDAYRYESANRTNAIMAKLTIFSAIFLPLSFITGFWGQNFVHLPFGSDAMLAIMLGSIVAIPLTLVIWFSKKGWM